MRETQKLFMIRGCMVGVKEEGAQGRRSIATLTRRVEKERFNQKQTSSNSTYPRSILRILKYKPEMASTIAIRAIASPFLR